MIEALRELADLLEKEPSLATNEEVRLTVRHVMRLVELPKQDLRRLGTILKEDVDIHLLPLLDVDIDIHNPKYAIFYLPTIERAVLYPRNKPATGRLIELLVSHSALQCVPDKVKQRVYIKVDLRRWDGSRPIAKLFATFTNSYIVTFDDVIMSTKVTVANRDELESYIRRFWQFLWDQYPELKNSRRLPSITGAYLIDGTTWQPVLPDENCAKWTISEPSNEPPTMCNRRPRPY